MALASSGIAAAQDFVVINKDARVFDQPKSSAYVTTNNDGEDVVLKAGMAFKKTKAETGWDKVEYTPGLNGFILQSLEATPAAIGVPKPGSYTAANSGEKAEVTNTGSAWTIKSPKGSYKGSLHNNVVVFVDEFSNPVYTLLVLSGKPILMSYDNAVTHFF